jgi:hypothetical protein
MYLGGFRPSGKIKNGKKRVNIVPATTAKIVMICCSIVIKPPP